MGVREKVTGRTNPPRPAATPAEPPKWDPPIPLDEPADGVPAFPIHVLPPAVGEFALAVAESVYCPADYPAVACLASASAAIGATFVAEIKSDFRQGVGLYCGLVGDPSVKKSPPIKHVIRPLLADQSRRAAEMREMEDGKGFPAFWENGCGDLVVSDTTVERLAELLQRQPRGLFLYRPELVGWLLSLNQYKAKGVGGDRSFFLEVYDSEPITIHRKSQGQGVVYVARPSLVMLGATQPDVVREFFDRRDGMAERILWSFPPQPPARGERWAETPPHLAAHWDRTLKTLLEVGMAPPFPDEKRPRPRTLRLDPAARPAWQEFTDRLAAVQNDPDFPARSKPAFGKLEGAAARLAVVLQMLDAAGSVEAAPETIRPRWVEAAAEVAFYFGAHARRVQRACGGDPRVEGAKRLLAWLREGRVAAFTRADLWRSLRRNSLFERPEDLNGPLRLLETHHVIRFAADVGGDKGRPNSPGYQTNPDILKAVPEQGV